MAQSRGKLAGRPGSRLDIGQAFFSPSFKQEQIGGLQQYYEYYTEELRLLQEGLCTQSWQIQALATKTCEDIFRTVAILRSHGGSKRPDIRSVLGSALHSTDEQSLNWSINLGLRLWLMINVQDPKFEGLRYQATCVQWDDETTLRVFVESLFPKSRWEITAQTSRLGPHFTAAFMYRICGLTIKWTTSLHDHLRLDRRHRALMVFPYKCHLQTLIECHQNSGNGDKPLVPVQVLKETILSLDLLFPFWDSDTVALLEREKQTFHECGPFEVIRTITLIDFEFWRDRLLELHEEIFQSPPLSWAQLFRDRRNPQMFWTFWVAMIILVLTVVSTVATLIQAWASVKALQSMS